MIHLQEWISAPREIIYDLLSDPHKLGLWWTDHDAFDVDGVEIIEHAPGRGMEKVRFAVIEKTPGERVIWDCISPTVTKFTPGCEWPGTQIRFDLRERKGMSEFFGHWAADIKGDTVLDFSHKGWPVDAVYVGFCATQWAKVLDRLRQVAEDMAAQSAGT